MISSIQAFEIEKHYMLLTDAIESLELLSLFHTHTHNFEPPGKLLAKSIL